MRIKTHGIGDDILIFTFKQYFQNMSLDGITKCGSEADSFDAK